MADKLTIEPGYKIMIFRVPGGDVVLEMSGPEKEAGNILELIRGVIAEDLTSSRRSRIKIE